VQRKLPGDKMDNDINDEITLLIINDVIESQATKLSLENLILRSIPKKIELAVNIEQYLRQLRGGSRLKIWVDHA
jgi:pyrimidine operon attenuation protein/uracil phosphoribosyltransferase